MKNNSLVFLGFALICLVNLNSRHHAVAAPKIQPTPAKIAAISPVPQAPLASTLPKMAVSPVEAPKKSISVTPLRSMHKLRDRQSEAAVGPVEDVDSVPKDDKLARPL